MLRYIADLHCDLLLYLQTDPTRTPFLPAARCCISQLRAGHVKLQTLAIFTETHPGSTEVGMAQAEVFKLLPGKYPEEFQVVQSLQQIGQLLDGSRIGIIPAIENASAFCEEEGPLSEGLERLRIFFGKIGRPLYVSLTWNGENRFGGGSDTTIGLKEDGCQLLEFLDGKQIAVDFSHASDRLFEEILSYVDLKQLDIPVLASHSNLRAVADVKRNLPDEFVKELFRRGGVIGMNFVQPFVGKEARKGFVAQMEGFLKLGGEDRICLGADFFCDEDAGKLGVGKVGRAPPADGWYFKEYGDSSSYGALISLWKEELGLSEEAIEKVTYRNVFRYLERIWSKVELTMTGGRSAHNV